MRRSRGTADATGPVSVPAIINDRDDAFRWFWAVFMGRGVERDGTVPGFDRFERSMTDKARRIAWTLCGRCWLALKARGGADAPDTIDEFVRIARGNINATA